MNRCLLLLLLAAPLLGDTPPGEGGCDAGACPITSTLPTLTKAPAMPSTTPDARPALDLKLPETLETATFGLG